MRQRDTREEIEIVREREQQFGFDKKYEKPILYIYKPHFPRGNETGQDVYIRICLERKIERVQHLRYETKPNVK